MSLVLLTPFLLCENISNMKPNKEIYTLEKIKKLIKPVMDKHQITEVYIFGSYARGEARSDSDIDIYCGAGDVKTLYDETDFIEELEKALSKKVDLVTIGSKMSSFFERQLNKDKIKII